MPEADLKAEFTAYCGRPSLYRCPCCDCLSLRARGDYQICRVCFWEDDGTDDVQADSSFGPNRMTLAQGRASYRACGACDRRMLDAVQPPDARQHEECDIWSGGKWQR